MLASVGGPGGMVPCGWANHTGPGATRRYVEWMRYGAVGCGTAATGGPGGFPGPEGSRPSADWIRSEAETNVLVLGDHTSGPPGRGIQAINLGER